MARPRPSPTATSLVGVLIGALLLLQLPKGTRAFLASAATRHTEGQAPTTLALVPFSVTTAVDDWVFPWVAPLLPEEEDNDYTSTLQQTSSSRSLLHDQRKSKAVWKSSSVIAKSPVWRPLESHAVVASQPVPSTYPHLTQAVPKQQSPYQVYCDLDGVLVDFCSGIRCLFPGHHASQSVDELNRRHMWLKVAENHDFFGQLPWMDGGKRLWNALRPLQPDILTGVPARVRKSSAQKFSWCQRELGVKVAHIDKAFGAPTPTLSSPVDPSVCRVITTWSNDKHEESRPGAVLIDDRLELRKNWEAKGGLFIHHSGCVDATLEKLRYYGVLPENDNDDTLLLP